MSNPWDTDPVYSVSAPWESDPVFNSGSSGFSSYTSPFADTGATSKVSFDMGSLTAAPWESDRNADVMPWETDSPFKFDPTVQSKVDLNSVFNPPGYLGPEFFQAPPEPSFTEVQSKFQDPNSLTGIPDSVLPWKHPLRAMNLPLQYVMGYLSPQMVNGKQETRDEAATKAMMEDKSAFEFVKNMEGMSNQTYRKNFSDTPEPLLMAQDPGAGSMAMAVQFGLDPMNILGGPLAEGVGEVAKLGGKLVSLGAGKIVSAEVPLLSKSIKSTAQFFDKFAYRIPGEKFILNVYDDAMKEVKANVINLAEDSLKKEQVVADAARKTGWNPQYIHKQLDDMIELKIPKEGINLFPREPMPYVKLADDATLARFIDDPISDIPKISMDKVPIVRGQSTPAEFEYNNLSKTSFSNIVGTAFGEDPPAAVLGLGGRNQSNKVVGFFTPDNPLYVERPNNTVTGLSEFALKKLFPDPIKDIPEAAIYNRTIGLRPETTQGELMWHSKSYARKIADDIGIPRREIDSLLGTNVNAGAKSSVGKVSLYDRIVSEEATRNGYDSIFAISPDTTHGEVAILDKNRLPTAIPDQIEKITPFKGDIEAIKARMQYFRPDDVNKITPEMYQLASDQVKLRNDRLDEAVKYGVVTKELEDEYVSYLSHVTTKDARKEMSKWFPETFKSNGKVINPQHASQLPRSLTKMGVNEINDRAWAGTLPGDLEGFKMPKGKKFLIDNPIMLEAYRHKRELEAVADAKVVWSAADRLGISKDIYPDGVQLQIARSSKPELKVFKDKLKDLRFAPEEAALLDQLITFHNYPKEQMAFAKLFDDVRNVWVKSTMNFSPSTWSRNMVGNIFNNYLAGLKNPKYYEMAKDYKDWKESVLNNVIGKGGKEEFILNGKPIKFSELDKQLKYTGVEGGGFATIEAEGRWEALNAAETEGLLGKAKRAWSAVNKPGRATNVYAEDVSRIAHYLYRMDQGKTPIESAASVKKYLFDYVSGLNKTEQALWRKTFPLMTFTRMNIPLQVQGILGLTDSFAPYIRLAQFANVIREHETVAPKIDKQLSKLTPEFIKENVGVPVVKDANGVYKFLMFGGAIPAADLYYLTKPGAMLNRVINSTHVLVKEISQQASNKDWFTKKDIDWGQSEKYLGFNLNPRVKHVLKNARALNDLDQIAQSFYEDPTRLTTTQRSFLEKTLQKLFGVTFTKVDYNMESKYWTYRYNDLMKKYRAAAYKGDTVNMKRFAQQIQEMGDSVK